MAKRAYCSDEYPVHDPGGCPDCRGDAMSKQGETGSKADGRVLQALNNRNLLPQEKSLAQDGFAAVRLTEGREWLDMATFSLDAARTMQSVAETNKLIPWWARDNVTVRIARVNVREVSHD